MARLRVRLHGKVIQEVQLSPERSYLAGRREDCDIVLSNGKAISREHFKIHFSEDQWQLEVLSRFGDVVVNGEKIQQAILEGQTIIYLRPYEFEYSEISSDLVSVPPSVNTPEPLFRPAFEEADEVEKTFIGSVDIVPYIKVISEVGEVKELFKLEGGNTWVAGRDPSCDIIIRDQRVSRRQFEVRRQGNLFQILDLGSVNGTLVNGNPVSSTDPINIKSGDAIGVLDNHLYFELHDPDFKARMELVKTNVLNPLVALNHEGEPSLLVQDPQHMESHLGYSYPAHGTPPQPNTQKKFDFEKHRLKLIAGAVLLIAVAYIFSDQSGTTPKTTQPPAEGVLNKLSPEQKILIKQTYMLAKNLYMQGKYELAKAEVSKIYELVPEYEDTKDIERLANEALAIQEQKRRQEELEKSKAETEEKIQKVADECKAKINADYTSSELEECLSSVLQFNPDHPLFAQLRHQVEERMNNKKIKEAQKAEYQSQVQKLHGLFNKAEASSKENQYLRALKEYQTVSTSGLPDPHDLKVQARKQMAAIQQVLKQKTDQFDQEADAAYKDQKLKDAILVLRKSADLNPNNNDTKDKISRYILELKKQMMILYQEGVLEESYGNVDGSENRPGAKDKWKKIMDLDIPDGEYYGKAKIKLKKYGLI
ncbi:MAG TPA: FHA domain-containing protein [Pseudobdellovibrionaceae bacterium]|jgi:pSer/pThr/pTyr-binding forkhead associated (FHA) protein